MKSSAKLFFLVLFLSFFLLNGQINVPKEFAARMKKYDVAINESKLTGFIQVKPPAGRFVSQCLLFKNAAEKINLALYTDSCAHHYNLVSEIRPDLVKFFGVSESQSISNLNAGQINVMVNADDYTLWGCDSARKMFPGFTDYDFIMVMALYNHSTKGKIYMVINYSGETSVKSEVFGNVFYCFSFMPHLSDPQSEPELIVQSGSYGNIRSIASSSTGELIAYGGDEGDLKICKGDGNHELRSVKMEGKAILSVSFSENEKLVAGCYEDSTIRLFEVSSGKMIDWWKDHKNISNGVVFFDHDTKILSIGNDSSIKFWEPQKKLVNKWRCYKSIKTTGGVPALLKTNRKSDAAAVFVAGGNLIIINLLKSDTAMYKCGFTSATDMLFKYSDLLLFSNGKNIVSYNINSRKERDITLPTDSAFVLLAGRKEERDSNNLKILAMTRYGYTQIFDYYNMKVSRTFNCAFEENPTTFYQVDFNAKYDLIIGAGSNKCMRYDLTKRELGFVGGHGQIQPTLEIDERNEFVLRAIQGAESRLFSLKSGRITWISTEDKMPVPVMGKIKFAVSPGSLIYLKKDSVIEVFNTEHKNFVYSYKVKKKVEDFYPVESDSAFIYLTAGRELYFHRRGEDKLINEGFPTASVIFVSDSELMLRKKSQRYLCNIFTLQKRPLINSTDSTEGFLAAANENVIVLYAINEKKFNVLDKKTLSVIERLPLQGTVPWNLTIHPYRNEVAYNTDARGVVVFNLDQNKIIKKFYPHKSNSYNPKFTADGKFLITHAMDKYTRFWDTKDYSLALTNFPSYDKDFITYTPDYNYVSNCQYASKYQFEFAYFSLGNSTFSLTELDLEYNRPDIIAKRLGYESPEIIEAYKKLHDKRLKRAGLSKDFVFKSEGRPIALSAYTYPPVVNASEQKMFFRLFDRDTFLKSIHIFFNDVPFADNDGYVFKNKEDHSKDMEMSFFMHKGLNKISIRVKDQNNVESYPLTIETYCTGYSNPIKPKLHIIGIGVSEFDSSKYNLKYPAKDVRDFVKLFQNQRNLYSKIIVDTLINERATLQNILALRKELNDRHDLDSVGVNDKIILFIASHGMLDKNLDYYLATRNVNFNNPSENGLLYTEIEKLLEGISPRNKVVLIDACHSGEIDKDEVLLVKNEKISDVGAIAFRASASSKVVNKEGELHNSINIMKEMFTELRKSSGATVISSAGGTEYAIEGEEWNNGVFSYSLMNGLRKHKADANNDGKIYLSELQKYIQEDVPRITGGRQQPTSRSENVTNDVVIWENDFNEELAGAIKINDKELVDKFLNEGADVSSVDTNGATTLMWAALYSDLDLVKKLIDRKADVYAKGIIYFNDDKTSYYGSLLNIAAGKKKMDLLKYLIEEKKINVDDPGIQKETKTAIGWPALTFSVSQEDEAAVEYLISKGANVNAASGLDKMTPLLCAFYQGNPSVCKKLIAAGANAKQVDSSGNTILMNSVYSPAEEVFKLAIGKYKEAVNIPADGEWYPIHAAAYKGYKDRFNTLIKNGARPTVISSFGFNILQLAVLSGNLEMVKEAYALCPEMLNKQSKSGETALMYVNREKKSEIAEFLISKGADVSLRDTSGNTLLMFAIRNENPRVFNMALEKNKELANIPTLENWYPIHQAAYYSKREQLKSLIKHGAQKDVVTKVGFTLLHCAVLSNDLETVKDAYASCPDLLNVQTFAGRTPLTVAAINKYTEIAEFLCSVGANVELKDKDGDNLETLAKYYDHQGLLEVAKKYYKK